MGSPIKTKIKIEKKKKKKVTTIYDLDDYSLLLIFDTINEFDTLIACQRVCHLWEFLVSVRIASTRYITVYDRAVCGTKYEDIRLENELLINFEHLDEAIRRPSTWNRNYVCPITLLRPGILPRLKIVYLTPSLTERTCFFLRRFVQDFLRRMPHLPGIIDLFRVGGASQGMGDRFELYGSKDGYPLGERIRQLRIQDCCLSRLSIRNTPLPNLKILYLNLTFFYPKPIPLFSFPNLQILVVTDNTTENGPLDVIFNLIDRCPRLESVHLSFSGKTIQQMINVRYRPSRTLRDLVIVVENNTFWSRASLFHVIERYQDLENLAIRLNENIFDDDVEEMIKHFPKLRLLDLRGCDNISIWSQIHLDAENVNREHEIRLLFGPYPQRECIHWCGYGTNFMEQFFSRNETPIICDDLPLR